MKLTRPLQHALYISVYLKKGVLCGHSIENNTWLVLVDYGKCILKPNHHEQGMLSHPDQWMRAGRSSSETARGREAPLHGLSPVKTGQTAAFSAPSADQKRAMGTPDYLAPEVLLGES